MNKGLVYSYKIDRSEPNHIYYNINISNESTQNLPFNYKQVLSSAIMDNPGDYEMSIIRFSLPGIDIPFFIVNNQTSNLSSADQVWNDWITLSYRTGGVRTLFQIQVPYPYTGYSVGRNSYDFSYYNYQQVINVINNAFATVWADLFAFAPAVGATPPKFYYGADSSHTNVGNELLSLVLPNPSSLFAVSSKPPNVQANDTVQIWFSAWLWRLFACFDWFGSNNYFNGALDNSGDPVENADVLLVPNGTGGSALTLFQQWNPRANWNQLIGVVITTSSIPVVSENLPFLQARDGADGLAYISEATGTGTGSNSGFPIISDFSINFDTGPDLFNQINYLPTAEYRMIDMVGGRPLNIVDFNVYLLDTDNNLKQFNIGRGSHATLKIMFRKKKNCC